MAAGETQKKPAISFQAEFTGFLNAPDAIRTHDLRFRKPTLYPAELRGLEKNTVSTLSGSGSY